MTKRILYHTSPKKIVEGTIKNYCGMFGTFLFFSNQEYVMSEGKTFLYSIEVDEDDIFEASLLFYEENCHLADSIVKETQEYFSVDEETAQSLLDGSLSSHDIENFEADGLASLELQLLSAKACAALGYKVIESRDEQGTCYMIDMFERESELTLIEDENI